MEDVAGHRVLRAAGRGDRARLLLGFADGATVVLKITPTGDPLTAAEVSALARASGEHVVELLDVGVDERDTVLVVERLPRGTLAELLERRSALDVGEAVTILAPIAATLDRLHGAGVAHGSLSLGAVGFREDGTPVLLGFGAAELFAPGAPEVVRETVAGVLTDRAALRDIAGVVLARVGGERAAAARRLAEGMGDLGPRQVADALFGLAAPTAVRFEDDAEPVPAARVGRPVDSAEDLDGEPTPALPSWLIALLPDSVREPVLETSGRVRRLWEAWSPGRRRLVLATGAGALTVALALAVVPPHGPAEAETVLVPPTPAPATPAPPTPALPDDPVDAAVLLLAERERCLRELSLLCFDTVVQIGSAAHEEDLALVRAVQAGGELPGDGIAEGDPVLVERLGDSALLDLPEGSEPASILLLRTAEGWRIRDYLAGVPALRG